MIFERMTDRTAALAAELDLICFSQPWTEKGFLEAIAQKDNIFLTAVDSDGRLAGYCGLYASQVEGEITNVAVDPAYRSRGIGYQLVEKTIEAAKEQGIQDVYLEVRLSNDHAKLLYQKAGFEACGIRKNFYQKPQEDALIMHAALSYPALCMDTVTRKKG